MPTITEAEAKQKLDQLIDATASSHQPVIITGQRSVTVTGRLVINSGDAVPSFDPRLA